MSNNERVFKTNITIRLPEQLAEDLQRAATAESNTASAVARRLIAEGLRRERRTRQREELEDDAEHEKW